MLQSLIYRINQIGILPEDEGMKRNQKNFLVYEAILMSMGGLIWGILCLLVNKPYHSIIPFGYIFLSLINILLFKHYKKFKPILVFQTIISLFLPFIFQWLFGGLLASGAVMIWAVLSLAASFSYSGIKTNFIWILVFVGLFFFSIYFDSFFKSQFYQDIAPTASYHLLIMNIGLVSLFLFFLMIFYISQTHQSYQKMMDAQKIAIASEKLAALGQLSAGVAHEINTPIGSIKALARESELYLEELPGNFFAVFNQLDDLRKKMLMKLITTHKLQNDFLTTREERSIRKNLEAELSSHQISDSREIASLLAQINITSINHSILALKGDYFKEAVTLLHRFFILQKNNLTILSSVEKTSRIVSALKMYLHKESEDKQERFQLKESVETVLTIYQNQLKAGVEIMLDIPEEIYLIGQPEEIGQVWTNLIVNACQAMSFRGELKISAKDAGESLIIEFTDTGSGISSETGDKIFEAFYSTKTIGEGTGLGLSIVKKIIVKHKGKISYTSEINKGTTFKIEIPKSL